MIAKWHTETPAAARRAVFYRIGRSAAARRPCSPLADQAELRWRMGEDAASLHVLRSAGLPVDSAVLAWIEGTVSVLKLPRSVTELEVIAAEWRRRRRMTLGLDAGQVWAEVRIAGPMDRPAPSWWWRFRHGAEPRPPRSCGSAAEL